MEAGRVTGRMLLTAMSCFDLAYVPLMGVERTLVVLLCVVFPGHKKEIQVI